MMLIIIVVAVPMLKCLFSFRVWVCSSPFSRLIQAAVLQTPLFLPAPHFFLASNPMFGWLNPSNANLHVCVGIMA